MMQPKKTKFNKQMKGRMRGEAANGTKLTVGQFGLQAMESVRLTGNQLEAARKVIVRETARKGKLWLRVFPDKPVTKKPAEVRMGSGKGDVDHYVALVKRGRFVFELGGVSAEIAITALKKASAKFPMKCRVISNNI